MPQNIYLQIAFAIMCLIDDFKDISKIYLSFLIIGSPGTLFFDEISLNDGLKEIECLHQPRHSGLQE